MVYPNQFQGPVNYWEFQPLLVATYFTPAMTQLKLTFQWKTSAKSSRGMNCWIVCLKMGSTIGILIILWIFGILGCDFFSVKKHVFEPCYDWRHTKCCLIFGGPLSRAGDPMDLKRDRCWGAISRASTCSRRPAESHASSSMKMAMNVENSIFDNFKKSRAEWLGNAELQALVWCSPGTPGFPRSWGTPFIIHSCLRFFHYKPCILGYLHFRNPLNGTLGVSRVVLLRFHHQQLPKYSSQIVARMSYGGFPFRHDGLPPVIIQLSNDGIFAFPKTIQRTGGTPMTVPSIESEHLVRSGIDIDHLGKMTPVWMQNAFKIGPLNAAAWGVLLLLDMSTYIYTYNILYIYIYIHI